MIAALTEVILPALFTGAGLFGAATLAATWRTYGARAGAFRAQLAALDDVQRFTVRVATVEVRLAAPGTRRGNWPIGRTVGQAIRRMDRPALRTAQRAAA